MSQQFIKVSIMIASMATIFVGPGCAQSEDDEKIPSFDEVAHRELTSLEPFLGTWRLSGVNGENNWHWDMTWSWAYPETMIFGDAQFEMSGPEMETVSAPWARAAMSWNNDTEAIEYTFMDLGTGFVEVHQIEPLGADQFAQTLIRTTNPNPVTQDTLIRFSSTKMTVTHSNRRDQSGASIPNESQTLVRID